MLDFAMDSLKNIHSLNRNIHASWSVWNQDKFIISGTKSRLLTRFHYDIIYGITGLYSGMFITHVVSCNKRH